MTTHTYHPDTHMHGLDDDCPRCQEHIQHPAASLDSENIRRLLAGEIHTRADQAAAAELRRTVPGLVDPA